MSCEEKAFNSETPLQIWKETPLLKPSHPSLPTLAHHAPYSDYLHRHLHTTTNLLPNSRVLSQAATLARLAALRFRLRIDLHTPEMEPLRLLDPSEFHVTLRARSLVSAQAGFVSLYSVFNVNIYHRPTRIRLIKTGEYSCPFSTRAASLPQVSQFFWVITQGYYVHPSQAPITREKWGRKQQMR